MRNLRKKANRVIIKKKKKKLFFFKSFLKSDSQKWINIFSPFLAQSKRIYSSYSNYYSYQMKLSLHIPVFQSFDQTRYRNHKGGSTEIFPINFKINLFIVKLNNCIN